MYGEAEMAAFVSRLPQGRMVIADGCNHYTVLLSPAGAAYVAAQIETFVAA